ncbi:hypothetical protein C8T65DRAFT_64841 [Cerioporus squamosus]|nr:hypothetical protein C8T65DRAFT_64841 [Cerioporus squamosus]
MITAGMRPAATYRVLILWAAISHVFPTSNASTDVACGNIDVTCILRFDLGHHDNSTLVLAYPRRRMFVADQRDSLHSAWEPPETPQDLFHPCDLVASTSTMTHRHSPSHPRPLKPWSSHTDSYVLEHPDICPSAAPPRLSLTSASSDSSRDRARLRRSTSVTVMSAACLHQHHHRDPAPEDFGDFALDAGSSSSRSPLGVLYHACTLWELASLASAVAWLLVCLAA